MVRRRREFRSLWGLHGWRFRLLQACSVCIGLLVWLRVAHAETRAVARFAPRPAWVEDIAPDLAPVDANGARDGVYALLDDTRIRLSPTGVERYHRRVRQAVNQAGVQTLGELEIEYAPEYQHLYLHRAALLRNGRVIDETGRVTLRIIEQERESENRVYSGSVSALLVLSDVRPGDIVDVAYSLNGSNPILKGRFAGHVSLGAATRVRRLHVEVSSAKSRPALHWAVRGSAPAPSDADFDSQRVLTWDLADVAPAPQDDRIPASFAVPALLTLSEFGSWSEVATWAAALYPAAPDRTLTEKARELRAAAPDLRSAVLAAIRFVQDDVRYLSISLGPHSVQPHLPSAIFRQRFGDCKDKSYLLVELLRALGVEAHAALADSDLREHLRESLPSPFAFDHVITRIELEGQAFWVDATWSHQGGRLGSIAPPDVGVALVVGPDTTRLEDVPQTPLSAPTRSTESHYLVDPDGHGTLNVATTYVGDAADYMRGELASQSALDLGHEYLNFYAKEFPGIDQKDPLDIQDQRDDDVLKISESYLIPEFWRDDKRTLVPDLIWNYLVAPGVTRRQAPLALSHPIWIRETAHVVLPFSVQYDPEERTLTDAAATLLRRVDFADHTATMTHEYKSLASEVPLAGLAHHLQFLAEARKVAGIDLENEATPSAAPVSDAATPPARPRSEEANWWPLMALLATLGLGVGLVWRFARQGRKKRAFLRKRDGASGELPSNAQSFSSLAAAQSAFTRSPCACGTPFDEDAIEFARLSYRERTLHVARARCASCHELKRAYFELPEGEEEEREDERAEGDLDA